MKKELCYINIEGSHGGNQDWFTDPMMRLGGCAAVCACDSSLYFAKAFGLDRAYPYNADTPCREDYIRFSRMMKPYLRPRWTGIDKPQIYIDGFGRYLRERGEGRISMTALSGERPCQEAEAAVKAQIDIQLPVPCLTLNHSDKAFDDYQWHWFMLTGYGESGDGLLVKAVTYSGEEWLSLPGLWDTGCTPKGGLILYSLRTELSARLL